MTVWRFRNQNNFNLKSIEYFRKRRQEQAKNIVFRNNIIQSTKRKNYIDEYDRISGALSHDNQLTGLQNINFNKRKQELKTMVKNSLYNPIHEIYNK